MLCRGLVVCMQCSMQLIWVVPYDHLCKHRLLSARQFHRAEGLWYYLPALKTWKLFSKQTRSTCCSCNLHLCNALETHQHLLKRFCHTNCLMFYVSIVKKAFIWSKSPPHLICRAARMTFCVLQGDQPLKATWSIEEGVELHSMPFSKPLGAVLAGHAWYHGLCCMC